jgi:hypothetical protein
MPEERERQGATIRVEIAEARNGDVILGYTANDG